MRSFQGSQNKTVKFTEINPVEDFAFTQCTSSILQFLGVFLVLFQYETVFNDCEQISNPVLECLKL